MALEYMHAVKPRVLYVSFDETDDWAHDHRYDRVLDSIAEFDGFLERLWNQIESMKEYRGHTTLIVTSDHGRGSSVRRLERSWAKRRKALIRSGWRRSVLIPLMRNPRSTSSSAICAPTIIRLMEDSNPVDYNGVTGTPIAAILPAGTK